MVTLWINNLGKYNIFQVPHTISACFWAVLLCPLRESFRHPDNWPNGSCCGCHAITIFWLQSPVRQSFLWRSVICRYAVEIEFALLGGTRWLVGHQSSVLIDMVPLNAWWDLVSIWVCKSIPRSLNTPGALQKKVLLVLTKWQLAPWW